MSNHEFNLEEIGARLRAVRKCLKITQQEMAEDLRMSKSYISEAENGKKIAGTHYFVVLLTKYNVSANYLFTGKGNMFVTKEEDLLNRLDFGNDHSIVIEILKAMRENDSIKYFLFAHFADLKAKHGIR